MSAILIFTLMQVLISCADNTGETDDLGTKDSTQNFETDDSAGNDESGSESQTVTSNEVGEPTGTQPDETIANETFTLNTDLLNEYMMTYAELTEKHGKVVGYERFDGGNFYLFENGYAYYYFYIDYDQSKLIVDQDTDLEYMPVDGNELCRGIRNISPEHLFNGTFETISIEAIANMDGINYVSTNSDGIVTPRAYASHFTYDGWNSDKVELIIYHEDEDIMDLTSEARIYIHPQDIQAEEGKK